MERVIPRLFEIAGEGFANDLLLQIVVLAGFRVGLLIQCRDER